MAKDKDTGPIRRSENFSRKFRKGAGGTAAEKTQARLDEFGFPQGLGLDKPQGEFDDLVDPMFDHVRATEPATEEEEEMIAERAYTMLSFVYDTGLEQTVTALRTGGQPFEAAASIALMLLEKVESDIQKEGNKPDPVLFFAEGSLPDIAIDALFEVGQTAGLTGYDDPDQYAGAVINLRKLMAQAIEKRGDEESISEVEELMIDMGMTQPDGSLVETREDADASQFEGVQRNKIAKQVSDGLRGAIL